MGIAHSADKPETDQAPQPDILVIKPEPYSAPILGLVLQHNVHVSGELPEGAKGFSAPTGPITYGREIATREFPEGRELVIEGNVAFDADDVQDAFRKLPEILNVMRPLLADAARKKRRRDLMTPGPVSVNGDVMVNGQQFNMRRM